ncbi:MAG: hypothetical protein JWN93_2973 [Hyphomicrobiales bacterium]|nr:hypothetical protein [Hyphomicrobiales bacterium]
MSPAKKPAKGSASPFWMFSLALYRSTGVPAACIALQDGHGVDVNLLLFGLWLASEGRALSPEDMRAADEQVADWRNHAVIPLRGVRRLLREPPVIVAGDAAAALRDKVKAVELEAERLQQEALFALRPVERWGQPSDPETAGVNNVDACAAMMGAPFAPAPRAALLAAFDALLARRAS